MTTITYFAEQLSQLRVGYLHVTEPLDGQPASPAGNGRITPLLREKFRGALIVNGGYDASTGHDAITRGVADLVAYGVPFLANPDLPRRYQAGEPLNAPDRATFFAGEEKGYIDSPALR